MSDPCGILRAVPKPKPKRKARAPKPLKRTKMRTCRKTPRRISGKRNPALVGWIHSLPCHHCREMHLVQLTRTECSHMPFSRSTGDENNVWPLCVNCHREHRASWHHQKRKWIEHYGRSGIAAISRSYTELFYLEHAA